MESSLGKRVKSFIHQILIVKGTGNGNRRTHDSPRTSQMMYKAGVGTGKGVIDSVNDPLFNHSAATY